MGQHRGKVGAVFRCFGASVNRWISDLGLAPLNRSSLGFDPAGAARTSQRDVPTTGAKGLRPGFKFQVHCLSLNR
jgi:hypothetical protein